MELHSGYFIRHSDSSIVKNIASTMLECVLGKDRVLLAVRVRHARDFLLAIPNSSLGKFLDQQLALSPLSSLNSGVCAAVNRQTESGAMDLFTVDLTERSEGMKRLSSSKEAFTTVGYPTLWKPPQLSTFDGSLKHPDGITLEAWTDGKQVVWVYTCLSTLADTCLQNNRNE